MHVTAISSLRPETFVEVRNTYSEVVESEDVYRLIYGFLFCVRNLHKVIMDTLINEFYREIYPLFVVSSILKGITKSVGRTVELENQDRKCLSTSSEEDLIETIIETKWVHLNGIRRIFIPVKYRRAMILSTIHRTYKGIIKEKGEVTKIGEMVHKNLRRYCLSHSKYKRKLVEDLLIHLKEDWKMEKICNLKPRT